MFHFIPLTNLSLFISFYFISFFKILTNRIPFFNSIPTAVTSMPLFSFYSIKLHLVLGHLPFHYHSISFDSIYFYFFPPISICILHFAVTANSCFHFILFLFYSILSYSILFHCIFFFIIVLYFNLFDFTLLYSIHFLFSYSLLQWLLNPYVFILFYF